MVVLLAHILQLMKRPVKVLGVKKNCKTHFCTFAYLQIFLRYNFIYNLFLSEKLDREKLISKEFWVQKII